MDLQWKDEDCEARFAMYVERLAQCLDHKDRVEPFRRYCVGLLLPGERKSVEPMAARLRPDRTAAEHQSLLHFVGQSPWDSAMLLGAAREQVLPTMTARSQIGWWIIDDTGFPKKGPHSVGVTRQYCGELGKQDNCQIAVSLSVATAEASLPIAWRLYLPQTWASDPERRAAAKVPPEVAFATKQQIALEQIHTALADGVPTGVVLADAGYGNNSRFRDEITRLGLDYVVGVLGNSVVWPPGTKPEVPVWSGRGKRPTRLRRGGDNAAVIQVRKLAEQLSDESWHVVRWREGVAEELCSRFAAVRVRPAQDDARRSEARPEHWLLVEWPPETAKPTKFWLSTLPKETAIVDLVYHAKQRWLIERDYLELKQELGLGHYEGRGWRGFHHHAALCIAAYGFLVAERAALSPFKATITGLVKETAVPKRQRPRGDPAASRTSCATLHRNAPAAHSTCTRSASATMSVLQPGHAVTEEAFMT
jgi:SRSO17 transposase